MSSKSKFQVAQSLADRIEKISLNVIDYEPEFSDIDHAFILGFRCSKQNNFLGLTTCKEEHNAGLAVLGISFFKSKPEENKLERLVQEIQEFANSDLGYDNFKSDKDNNLFLIYYPDDEPKGVARKLYDSSTKEFLTEQPAIVTVDESKILAESIVTSIKFPLHLAICNGSSALLSKEVIVSKVDQVSESFTSNLTKIKLILLQSNFSCSLASNIAGNTDALYEKLEAPADVLAMGDYLPQMSKKEKEAAVTKWKNKLKNQRAPLEVLLEHQDFSVDEQESKSNSCLVVNLEIYTYLQANNPLAKTLKCIAFQICQSLRTLKDTLLNGCGRQIKSEDLKWCTFNPSSLSHFVSTVYFLPNDDIGPDFKQLSDARRNLHLAYMLPLDRPAVRLSQRIRNVKLVTQDELEGYLCNVHSTIVSNSGVKGGTRSIAAGTYAYHHYMQSRISDNGWGCAYRSLQTIISWYKNQGYIYSPDVQIRAHAKGSKNDKSNQLRLKLHIESRVPTHEEIQTVLVEIGDKQPSFVGSQKWIGSQEVCYVLNHLYDLDSKFISVSSGGELVYKARDLSNHFLTQSTPVMIGGGVLAHTIIGIDFQEKSGDISYLILDPHYTGTEDLSTILKKGWCGWKKSAFWDKNAFYNLCLPQRPVEF